MLAADSELEPLVEFLLTVKGIDLNMQDGDGQTALHYVRCLSLTPTLDSWHVHRLRCTMYAASPSISIMCWHQRTLSSANTAINLVLLSHTTERGTGWEWLTSTLTMNSATTLMTSHTTEGVAGWELCDCKDVG
jgi:hypothetical protein